ncbi:hypothetical protein ACQP3F_31935, partial [Escherichia coli]
PVQGHRVEEDVNPLLSREAEDMTQSPWPVMLVQILTERHAGGDVLAQGCREHFGVWYFG